MTPAMMERIASRLKARREELGVSQAELAERMGFNNRQTLAAIENRRRGIQPAELVAAARALDIEPGFFTDPYIAAGEAKFSFRAENGDDATIADFEVQAGRWLATYRELTAETGHRVSFLAPSLALTTRSSFEDAQAAAEQVRHELGLGSFPAVELAAALEREWGVLVLHVDSPAGISGAASRLRGLQVVFINRRESVGRRHFDLAHELFHLLTWDAMPPRHIDSRLSQRGATRIERLADNFAAALLMPEQSVAELWHARSEVSLVEWISHAASRLGVSGPALKWRLLNLGYVSKSELPADEAIAGATARVSIDSEMPPLFSASFIHRVCGAVESGLLSVRKASRLLGMELADLATLCRTYGRQLSYEV